jgi:eukaryotic-like serine/threonine-protein kinase
MNTPVNYQLGSYRLEFDEGHDGLVRYYRGRRMFDNGMERPCRVRVVELGQVDDAEFQSQLLAEARLLIGLKHPGIVATQDYLIIDDRMVLENELVEGEWLESLLRRFGQLDQGVALTITSRLAEILAYVHRATGPGGGSMHLVHRNLLPRHVLITTHGETKLAGFGMAQFRGKLLGTTLRGSYGDMACLNPEEARHEPADYRSDLFGLGTLLFRMVTGQEPFLKKSFEETRDAILRGSYAPPASLRPDLDPRVETLLGQLLHVDPRQRPASAWTVWKQCWKLWRAIGTPSDELRLRELVVKPTTGSYDAVATLD